MSEMKLRTRIPLNYYEPEEPSFDEYIYCDLCRDFVYEYCSVHGPLLVVPDNKVPLRTDYPHYVPRAALTTPSDFLHIAQSIIPGAGLGVFASLTLPRGVRFGPFCGVRTQHPTPQYCWKIQDRNMSYKHAIDASDANASNWMRYVNCARHWHEQNLVAYQYRGQIYYRTVKIIPRFTELMVFYGSECAMALNIDMRNYNSDYFCQTIACRKSNMDAVSAIGKFNNFIQNSTNEDTNIDMSFEGPGNDSTNDYDLIPTTIEDFVMIDYPEDALDSKLNTNQENMNTKSDEPFQILPSDNENDLTCHICQKIFAKRYNLKRHSKTHDVNRNESKSLTKDTYKNYLDSNSLKNQESNMELKSNDISPDIFPSDSTNDLTCNICQKSFTRRYGLKRHYKIHEVNRNESKSLTKDTHKDNLDLSLPKNQESNMELKSNDISPDIFPSDSTNDLTCNICQKSFTKRYGLKRHYKIHDVNRNKSNTIIINTVEDSFNTNFRNDLENCTDRNSDLTCHICQKSFTKRYDLKRHSTIHDVNKNQSNTIDTIKCNVCDKICRKYNIFRHKLTHSEKRYSCTQCPFKSNFMYILKDHIKSHSEPRLYKCDLCLYHCNKRRYIVNHLRKNHK